MITSINLELKAWSYQITAQTHASRKQEETQLIDTKQEIFFPKA